MASTEVIVLSSSPSRSLIATTPPRDFDYGQGVLMSSSPSFPSPSKLFLIPHRPGLYRGTRANAISASAIKGFTRASCLLAPDNATDAVTISSQIALNSGQIEQRPHGPRPYVPDNYAAKPEDITATSLKRHRAPQKRSTSANELVSNTKVAEGIAVNDEGGVTVKKPRVRKSKGASIDKDVVVQGDTLLKKAMARKGKDKDSVNVSTDDGTIIKKRRARKSKDDGSETANKQGDPTIRKPRARKSKDESQTTIAKPKIIKSSTVRGSKDAVEDSTPRAGKETVNTADVVSKEGSNHISISNEPLGLDLSIPRKRDWTPLRDDEASNVSKLYEPEDLVLRTSEDAAIDDNPRTHEFSTLRGDFSYVQLPGLTTMAIPQRMITGEALTKRQKLELIDIPAGPLVTAKPSKGSKASKKKPQTITAKATADFRPVEPPTASSPILQYLTQPSQEDASGKPPEKAQNDEIPKRRARKVQVRPKRPKDTDTGAKKSIPILLAPEEAMKAAKDQDLLFGTSSQLMREDSPSFVRDLQTAIEASESLDHFVDINDIENSKPRSSEASFSLLTASRKLWSEAARDSHGELLDVEVLDLATTPNIQQSISTINIKPSRTVEEGLTLEISDRAWTSVNDFASPTPMQIETAKEAPKISGQTIHENAPLLPRSIAEAALRARRKSRSPVKKTKVPVVSKEPIPGMPRFQAYTMNELGKAISGYGFKPIKGRDTLIALLEKCWESKNRLALQSLPPNTNVPSVAPATDTAILEKDKKKSVAKRRGRPSKFDGVPTVEEVLAKTSIETSISPVKPRGRPRKTAMLAPTNDKSASGECVGISKTLPNPTTPMKRIRTARKPPADDIEDPNPPPTPSPPRRRTPLSPPQALSLANSGRTTTTKVPTGPSFSSQTQPDLFAKITEAITTFPPTHDPKNMTWYEKILVYDPIVLEDLATWLNTEGLGRVGVDEEVHPGAVRAWCEERSVCCLWKENLRGGARKRY